jgi:ribonuclease J
MGLSELSGCTDITSGKRKNLNQKTGGYKMKLTIHRGAAQIGGNIVGIASETAKIVLDCGRNLPPLDGGESEDGIDIPGLTSGASAYDAVFVTHYHADHCGLIERVNADIPIYAGQETKDVLSIIADFIDAPLPRVSQIIEPGIEVSVGGMKILPIGVRHSAKGAMMFLVEADGQKLLYTGDFSQIDETCYALLGGVGALLCEGTNIGARGGKTEQDIADDAAKIMRDAEGQVFVLCSATNIERIGSIERACRESGRTIAIDPFMKAVQDRLSPLTFANSVGFVANPIGKKKLPRAFKYLSDNIGFFNGAKVMARMTNLTFMVRQNMGRFLRRLDGLAPLRGSTLIYSMWRGYENHGKTKRFLGICRELGLEIKYLHTSGHAYRDSLGATIACLNPKTLVPIHTESADTFRELHRNVTLLADGEVFSLNA